MMQVAESRSVVVVGAGPAGLTAAIELDRRGVRDILVLEREHEAGGVPRHCDHLGFGLRDLRRSLSGPAYARRLAELAGRARGVELRTSAQVTGWTPAGALEVTSPSGRVTISAGAVLLATGCRERPRSARLIAGDRPARGVMSTGTLQQLVHLDGVRPGRRAVVVGAEHVSYSALATLRHAGARAVAMVTGEPAHQSLAGAALGAKLLYGVPLRTCSAVTSIHGRSQVEAVTVTDLRSGRDETLPCDLVVLTGDWIPDHELAVLAGADLDPGTRGPRVDAAGRTAIAGVFATGNAIQGAEPADLAARHGRAIAASVRAYLDHRAWPDTRQPIIVREPLHWIAPNAVSPAAVPDVYRIRALEMLRDARVEIRQDGRLLDRRRLPRVMPGRSARLTAGWTSLVDPRGSPPVIALSSARRPGRSRSASRH